MRSGLSGLYAVAENYPQLKASEPFRHLQERIGGLRDRGSPTGARSGNDAVNTNNVRIAAFPDLLVARSETSGWAQLLHIQGEAKADVDLKAAFSG
jgi:LemA protein